MDYNGEQPIIIKKKRRAAHGHHGGAWKVAFADFMTAMMAFFLVMWMVGQKDEVKQAVAGYFRDPGKFKTEGSSGMLKGSKSVVPADDPTMGIKNNPTERSDFVTDSEKNEMKLAAKKVLEELEKQSAFDQFRGNVNFQMTREGLRIILNESQDAPAFFEPGSAKLLQKSAVILMTIARELGKLKNHIVIEGHTDATFNGHPDYTNWELSADRANSARRLMEVSGLYEDQVRAVRGFADQIPMIKEDTHDARNRRVTLLVLYSARDNQYDELAVGEDLADEL
jgi:chemotaxis protein MotB